MRSQKKRLSDINPFKICFYQLNEEREMLRYEVKSISIRRLRNGKGPLSFNLSDQAWKMLHEYGRKFINLYRVSWAINQREVDLYM